MIETEIIDNFIKVPCFRYVQASKCYYSITLPMTQLDRFLSIDSEFDVLKRSQRLVNEARVKKFIKYLKQGKFIVPALTGFIEGECKFKEFGKASGIGFLEMSLDSVIKLFDGQHRASGIISACRQSYELKQKLQKSSITLNLTNSLSLVERQQFFSDINTNVSKPPVSLSTTYNKNDSKTVLAHKILDELGLTRFIEYEKNVINKDDKFKMYTLKAFVDSLSKAFNIKNNTEITDSIICKAAYIYSSWSKKFNWKTTDVHFCRNTTLNFHNIMIIIMGEVTKELLFDHDNNDYIVAEKIDNSSIDYLTSFKLENLYGVCIDENSGRVKLDSESKYKLKQYLLNFIIN